MITRWIAIISIAFHFFIAIAYVVTFVPWDISIEKIIAINHKNASLLLFIASGSILTAMVCILLASRGVRCSEVNKWVLNTFYIMIFIAFALIPLNAILNPRNEMRLNDNTIEVRDEVRAGNWKQVSLMQAEKFFRQNFRRELCWIIICIDICIPLGLACMSKGGMLRAVVSVTPVLLDVWF